MTKLFSLLAMAMLPLTAQTPIASRSFTIANTNATVSVARLWFKPTGGDRPFEEVTLTYPIGPKSKSTLTLGGGDPCLYSVRIRFSDGTDREYDNVNVCRGATVEAP